MKRNLQIVFPVLLIVMSVCLAGWPIFLSADTTSPEVLFTSQHNVQEKLLQAIRQEKESIRIAVYRFSDFELGRALIEAHKKGVRVELIVDPISIKKKSPLGKMARSGIPVFVWHPPSVKSRAKPLMHHKFCLFGKKSVWTGSYNFSYQAVRAQRENAVILHDEEISQQFAQEFENMRKDHVVTYEKYLEQVPFKWASKTR